MKSKILISIIIHCSLFIIHSASAETVRIEEVAKDIVHIQRSAGGKFHESGLSRYGFIKLNGKEKPAQLEYEVSEKDGIVSFKSKVSKAELKIELGSEGKGYGVAVSLKEGERIYGIGDSSRKSVQRRGGRYEMWVSNCTCDIPIPMCLSSEGWGLVNNSTWRHAFDVGVKDKNALRLEAEEGWIDLYVFVGKDYRALLEAYTRLTGRPQLLPIWGYGLTYVANQEINDFELCAEARTFRKEDIPCDLIGLEPGWMEKDYDMSINKFWDRKKFHIPYWTDNKGQIFIGALDRMGFKLSLWTCCDYDLTRYEEEVLAGKADEWKTKKLREPKKEPRNPYEWWAYKFNDEREEAGYPADVQPWFEHYKKFVKEGVRAFKLDGSNQFGEHPDRKWANGMSDREVHNLFTAIYGKQMSRGYEDFAKERSMINSAGGYLGVHHYTATWAGDTGGGPSALMSAQCLGFSGHSNTSSDLETSPEGMHYGFLQAWTFHDNWDYWDQPWYLGEEREARFRFYAKLRYRLMPYLYTAAAEAHRTGFPIVRALALEYPDHPEYDEVKGTYLLGHDLLVTAFDEETVLPPGTWYDFRTGEKVKGPARRKVVKDDKWGGALYVRAGAVIPTWNGMRYLKKGWNEEVEVLVYPHDGDGETTYELYEDDGESLGYRKGEGALTPITVDTKSGKAEVRIGARRGAFKGMGEVKFRITYPIAQ